MNYWRIFFAIKSARQLPPREVKAATALLLKRLKLPTRMPIVTGDDVKKAKLPRDIFEEAAHRLHIEINNCIVVGDSEWDLLAAVRKSALGWDSCPADMRQAELERAGAFRVYFRCRRHAHAHRTAWLARQIKPSPVALPSRSARSHSGEISPTGNGPRITEILRCLLTPEAQ